MSSYAGASGPTAYYRSVAEVDPWGHIFYTDTDDYSGDNSRGVMKGDNWLYYVAGNDNNGGLSKSQVGITQLGFDLSHSTGAELITPGAAPLVPPGNNMLGFFTVGKDKPGKDTNFRGLTIFDNTVYVTKGSGGNGVNTVYQVGPSGTLPTTSNAPGTPPATVNFSITPLPGFPQVSPTPDTSTTANTASLGGYYPFGVWFANSSTLYVCNEGDLVYTPNQVINGQVNVANSGDLAPNTMFSRGPAKVGLEERDLGAPVRHPKRVEPGRALQRAELSGVHRARDRRLPQHRRRRQSRRHRHHLRHHLHHQPERRQWRRSQ